MKNATQRIPRAQDLIFSIQRIFEGGDATENGDFTIRKQRLQWYKMFQTHTFWFVFQNVFYVARADFFKKYLLIKRVMHWNVSQRAYFLNVYYEKCIIIILKIPLRALFVFGICGVEMK